MAKPSEWRGYSQWLMNELSDAAALARCGSTYQTINQRVKREKSQDSEDKTDQTVSVNLVSFLSVSHSGGGNTQIFY